MDTFFNSNGGKLQMQNGLPATVAGAFDFASFSQLASQQAATKQAAIASTMQDYIDDRWKDHPVSAVTAEAFPGSSGPTGQVVYDNDLSHTDQNLLIAQQSMATDFDMVAAASRNFGASHVTPLQLIRSNNSTKQDLAEQCHNIHSNEVNSYLTNSHEQQLQAALETHQQDLMGIESPDTTESEEESFTAQIVQAFLWIEAKLCAKLKFVNFGDKVSYVYNPLEYASAPHAHYISQYIGTKSVLFLGMNPGPFGMAQNGVPFGDTRYVRDWLKITGNVHPPPREHPRRTIQGLDCTRSEVSGARFWGFIAKACGTPEQFFRHCFVHNYCPLVFMTKTGKNIIPAALPALERRNLEAICDEALLQCIRVIRAQIIVAIGKYAADRVTYVLQNAGDESATSIRIERILHPSPASPQANRGWEETVSQQLQESGIMQYLQAPG